jgi:hypothetical protein
LGNIPKSRPPFDKLRANGILECSTAVFRMIKDRLATEAFFSYLGIDAVV